MRITDTMMQENFISNLQNTLDRLNTLNQQVTSGSAVNAPSDAPEKIGRMINLRDTLTNIDQYKINSDSLTAFMQSSITPLQTMTNIMQDVQTTAMKGANATYNASDRAIMANDINTKLQEMLTLANTQSGGQYVFAGFKSDAMPFNAVMTGTAITSVSYSGDGGLMPVEVTQGQVINKNIPGTVFKNGTFDIFQNMIKLRDDLNANDPAAISGDLAGVQASQDTLTQYTADMGATQKRSQNISATIDATKLTLQTLQTKLQAVDMPTVLSSFQLQQNVYNAAIKSISTVLSMRTLADVLS